MNYSKKYGMGWWKESERHRLARLGVKTGRKVSYSRTEIIPIHVEMDMFGVDSGQVMMTDPAYIDKIAKHYDYDKMVKFMYDKKALKRAGITEESKNYNKFIDERRALYLYIVAKKSFPEAGANTDKLMTIQNTGGDGSFEVKKRPGKLIINYAKEDISKEDLKAYETVRESGVTNMFDVKTVESLSGLSRDKIMDIMKNYDYLTKKYSGVRKDYSKVNYQKLPLPPQHISQAPLPDQDKDGVPDIYDWDDDNDGVPDWKDTEGMFDLDRFKGKGVFNPLYDSTLDSDFDGIPDIKDLHPLNPHKGIEWAKKSI